MDYVIADDYIYLIVFKYITFCGKSIISSLSYRPLL